MSLDAQIQGLVFAGAYCALMLTIIAAVAVTLLVSIVRSGRRY